MATTQRPNRRFSSLVTLNERSFDAKSTFITEPLDYIARAAVLNLSVKDRIDNFKTYKDTFRGDDFIDFIVENYGLSTDSAIKVGNEMISHDFIVHVRKGKLMENKVNSLYKFQKGVAEREENVRLSGEKPPDNKRRNYNLATPARANTPLNNIMKHMTKDLILSENELNNVPYENTFMADDLLNWLKHFNYISNVADGIQLGNILISQGYIVHVNKDKFTDARFNPFRYTTQTKHDFSITYEGERIRTDAEPENSDDETWDYCMQAVGDDNDDDDDVFTGAGMQRQVSEGVLLYREKKQEEDAKLRLQQQLLDSQQHQQMREIKQEELEKRLLEKNKSKAESKAEALAESPLGKRSSSTFSHPKTAGEGHARRPSASPPQSSRSDSTDSEDFIDEAERERLDQLVIKMQEDIQRKQLEQLRLRQEQEKRHSASHSKTQQRPRSIPDAQLQQQPQQPQVADDQFTGARVQSREPQGYQRVTDTNRNGLFFYEETESSDTTLASHSHGEDNEYGEEEVEEQLCDGAQPGESHGTENISLTKLKKGKKALSSSSLPGSPQSSKKAYKKNSTFGTLTGSSSRNHSLGDAMGGSRSTDDLSAQNTPLRKQHSTGGLVTNSSSSSLQTSSSSKNLSSGFGKLKKKRRKSLTNVSSVASTGSKTFSTSSGLVTAKSSCEIVRTTVMQSYGVPGINIAKVFHGGKLLLSATEDEKVEFAYPEIRMEIKNSGVHYKHIGVVYLTNTRLVFSRFPVLSKREADKEKKNQPKYKKQDVLHTFSISLQEISQNAFQIRSQRFFGIVDNSDTNKVFSLSLDFTGDLGVRFFKCLKSKYDIFDSANPSNSNRPSFANPSENPTSSTTTSSSSTTSSLARSRMSHSNTVSNLASAANNGNSPMAMQS